MYITYINQQKMQKVTCSTDIITERNIAYAQQENGNLVNLCEEAKKLLDKGVDNKYTTYYKKKSNGQKRQINVPDDELKTFMRKVVKKLTTIPGFIWPEPMYAFIHGRGTKQLANLHKDARTIIHMDIKDFFDSCTFKFVVQSMRQVYPFCLMDWSLLEPIVRACMLNGRLAQGAPTSPILSSIAMIPFVTEANNWAKSRSIFIGKLKRTGHIYKIGRGTIESLRKRTYPHVIMMEKKVTFSMYADDIFISINLESSVGTKTEDCIQTIESLILEHTPLRLNKKKTRYVDVQRKGGAWITGLMINREHKVTVGRKKKERLKAMIFSFLADCKNGKTWDEHRVRKMIGAVSHIRYIEPEFVDMIIEKYNQKLGMNYHKQIKDILYS